MTLLRLQWRRGRSRYFRRCGVAVVETAVLVALFGCADATTDPEALAPSARQEPAPDWTTIAPSPLSPRHGTVGVWTGEEMLVVGGTSAPPCPPNADCAGPADGTLNMDGAAYDPATDTWRVLAPAPRPVIDGLAVWSGTEMVVVAEGATMAYDPPGDSWRILDAAPRVGLTQAVVTDHGLVFGSYDQRARPTTASDWLLDPGAGTWSPLPADPFDESYDRSLAWDGERLWLLSMSVGHHFEAYDGAASRVAVLDGDQWRTVSTTTPPLAYGQRWWWFQDRLVAPVSPSNAESQLGVYVSPGSTEWTTIPPADPTGHDPLAGCPLPAAGAGNGWLAGGGPVLTSVTPLTTTLAPPCRQFGHPDIAVWTGTGLIVWGGAGPDFQQNVSVGLTWTPPHPGA